MLNRLTQEHRPCRILTSYFFFKFWLKYNISILLDISVRYVLCIEYSLDMRYQCEICTMYGVYVRCQCEICTMYSIQEKRGVKRRKDKGGRRTKGVLERGGILMHQHWRVRSIIK